MSKNQRQTTHPVDQWSWDELAEALVRSKRKVRGTASETKALSEYFEDKELKELQHIADLSQQRRSAGTVGNMILLHGIMGSNLIVKKKGDEDLVWVNLLRIAGGRMEDLRRNETGDQEASKDVTVLKGDPLKQFYAKTVLRLRGRWNLKTFSYDWRKDINLSSKELESFIEKEFPNEPVHLVAHSMGGLVCRNMIRLNPKIWERLFHADRPEQGGRLIMLGTPNYGAFTWVQVLTGEESMLKWIAALDFSHNTTELSEIVGTFPGGYQMLPAPSKLSPLMVNLYQQDSWGNLPAIGDQLRQGYNFQETLDLANVIDPDRMRYIAGYNQATICGMKIVGPGDFNYLTTLDGDGRVPHTLGLLPGVPTYYADEAHGNLPKNDKVIDAVDELLATGGTTALPAKPIRARLVPTEELRYQRLAQERDIFRQLKSIGVRHKEGTAEPNELRFAERVILDAAMGAKPSRLAQKAKETETLKQETKDTHLHIELHIQTKLADVTEIETPVMVVGHYRGIPPIRAVGALDKAMHGWITKAGENGMIAGELGETYFIPVPDWAKIKANTLMLAGMGEEGKFTSNDLQYLLTNVTLAVLHLKHNRVASVLIGSGEGNLDPHSALHAMFSGITEAIRQTQRTDTAQVASSKFTWTLVDYDPNKLRSVHARLGEIKKDGSLPNTTLHLNLAPLPKQGNKKNQPGFSRMPMAGQESAFATRLTIERDRVHENLFRFSSLSNTAVVPVREKALQTFIVDETSVKLRNSMGRQEQETHGKLLYTYLLPEDFHSTIRDTEELSLILDRSTASIPWEMACFKGTSGTEWWGTDLQLSRQFKTLLSSASGMSTKPNRKLRVLVIADPAKEEDLHLPGARQEGRQVARAIRDAAVTLNKSIPQGSRGLPFEIDVVECIGPDQCDLIEILALLLTEEFDIVHFAGHGTFDQDHPSKSGWVFGHDRLLTPSEIFQARKLPPLVFANACFSGQIREGHAGEALSSLETNKRLAGMAEAFFERGIQSFIGTGWPVGDEQAATFATTFYTELLRNQHSIGKALAAARNSILHDGSTWGAYQHYGKGSTTILAPLQK